MNNTIFYFFYSLAHRSDILDKVILFFAYYFPFAVVILAGLFLLFHHDIFRADNPYEVFLKKKIEILKVFLASVCVYFVAFFLKYLFQIPRPVLSLNDIYPLIEKTSFSFPSEHASFFMALAFSLFFLHKKAGYWFISFAVVIGIARIIAGVHFPVDILGGFILGALVAYFLKNVYPHT